MYRHVITFPKCIHYFSSKTPRYFSHRVQGNLHCTHVMVYTDHCTFTKVCAVCSSAFIINELVIWSLSLLDCSFPWSAWKAYTVGSRILNPESGWFCYSSFCPRPFGCTISLVLPPLRKQDIHKYGFVQGGGCELEWSPDLRLWCAKKLAWDGLLKVSAICSGWLDRHSLASNLNLKPPKKKIYSFGFLLVFFFFLTILETQVI